MSVDECQERHSSTEFFDMMDFVHWTEWEEDKRIFYYLAQIAAEIRNFRLVFTTPEKEKIKPVSAEDMLMKFGKKGEAQKAAEQMEPPQPKPDPRSKFEMPVDEDPEVAQKKLDAIMAHFAPFIVSGVARVEDGSGTATTT